MRNKLEARRQQILRELDRTNRQIVWTRRDLARLRRRIGYFSPAATKPA